MSSCWRVHRITSGVRKTIEVGDKISSIQGIRLRYRCGLFVNFFSARVAVDTFNGSDATYGWRWWCTEVSPKVAEQLWRQRKRALFQLYSTYNHLFLRLWRCSYSIIGMKLERGGLCKQHGRKGRWAGVPNADPGSILLHLFLPSCDQQIFIITAIKTLTVWDFRMPWQQSQDAAAGTIQLPRDVTRRVELALFSAASPRWCAWRNKCQ